MSEPQHRRNQKVRSSKKGRVADPQALREVRDCLAEMPRRRDLLIEYLHLLQDRFGHLSARHLVALARELRLSPAEVYEVASFYHRFDLVPDDEAPPPPLTVRVCTSVTCSLFGAEELASALEAALGEGVRVQRVPCLGRCHQAPVAVVGERPVGGATPEKIAAAVVAGDFTAPLPEYVDYDRYRREGGYRTYRKCLSGELSPEAVLARLEASGLRGLGGAGFPVGRKWRIVREQPAPRRLAVNIDEGEPGTFKDGHYLRSDPHRFLEGALIAATVVGIEASPSTCATSTLPPG